jgi:hypothetical protein
VIRSIAVVGVACVWAAAAGQAHDFGTNPPTWNREMSRLVYGRCASCHRVGGTAFPLMTYQEAQPRAVAIKDAVLARRMPPWGAVKGFGDFANDQGLTQEQVDLVSDWVEGGMLKGNNPNTLPQAPKFDTSPVAVPPLAATIRGDQPLTRPMVLSGLLPLDLPHDASMQIVAALPDGRIEPLVWLYEYRRGYEHPFLFRRPMRLPVGTIIRGIVPPASIRLLGSFE